MIQWWCFINADIIKKRATGGFFPGLLFLHLATETVRNSKNLIFAQLLLAVPVDSPKLQCNHDRSPQTVFLFVLPIFHILLFCLNWSNTSIISMGIWRLFLSERFFWRSCKLKKIVLFGIFENWLNVIHWNNKAVFCVPQFCFVIKAFFDKDIIFEVVTHSHKSSSVSLTRFSNF